MSEESIKIPIEYHISTTSDWTTFQIVEGGWWSNMQVECLRGFDRLRQKALFDGNKIAINKAQGDRALVEVRARCTLNIDKNHLNSYIFYLISKGDLPSTLVKIIIDGREIHKTEHSYNISGEPHNSMLFYVLANLHVSAFQKREKKIVPEKTKANTIAVHFHKNFEKIFNKKNPEKKDVEEVFGWLKSHGRNARTFLNTEICEKLTLETETHFMQFPNLKKNVSSESEKTLEEITRRHDKLRETYGERGSLTERISGKLTEIKGD